MSLSLDSGLFRHEAIFHGLGHKALSGPRFPVGMAPRRPCSHAGLLSTWAFARQQLRAWCRQGPWRRLLAVAQAEIGCESPGTTYKAGLHLQPPGSSHMSEGDLHPRRPLASSLLAAPRAAAARSLQRRGPSPALLSPGSPPLAQLLRTLTPSPETPAQVAAVAGIAESPFGPRDHIEGGSSILPTLRVGTEA